MDLLSVNIWTYLVSKLGWVLHFGIFVALLVAMYFYMCVGSVVGLFSCVVWSLVNMFGGWLDSFSLVASLHGVYL